ncbi:MAG: peptidoglycan-binding protein [Oscillospiraceae bacterium]|nr:peptidoglycan-binding protein [Oscillospiraceae bacterium]
MRPPESFTAQPIRSLQTMLRVIAEDDKRIPTVIPDGIFGPATMYAVTAFQRIYGLPQTGIADQQTWDAIVPVYEEAYIRIEKAEPVKVVMNPGQVYRLGDAHTNIYLTQGILAALAQNNSSILPPELSGVLDDTTSSALSAFQYLNGLPQTGELDRITWKNLAKQFSLQSHHDRSAKF